MFGMPSPAVQSTPALWAGPGGSFIGAGIQNPTRAGSSSSGALNSLRHSSTWDLEIAASLGLPILSASGGYAHGRSNTDHDFFDFNGDGYPDAIALDGTVQFGDGAGAFSGSTTVANLSSLPALRRVEHATIRGSVGSSDNKLINDVGADGRVRKKLTTGFSVGIDYGESTTQVDWVDVNGDGLPDAVQRDPSVNKKNPGQENDFNVQLNYGNRLGPSIPWPATTWNTTDLSGMKAIQGISGAVSADGLFSPLSANLGVNGIRDQDSGSDNVNVGGGVNIGGASVGGGGGFTFNSTRTLVDLVDVNGDGLPDEVMKMPNDQVLRVRLNLGGQFDSQEQLWDLPTWAPGSDSDADAPQYSFIGATGGIDDALDFRRSKTFTASFEFQFCFIVCVGASAYYANGSSWANQSFQDVNGDGKPDMIFRSRGNGQVFVKLNQVDGIAPVNGTNGTPTPPTPVNLLSAVHRPLGGNFVMTYAREGNLVLPNTKTDEPTNEYVLSNVDADDGMGNHYVRSIVADPSGFHDRIEREDYGFAKCTTTREDASTVETDYQNQDFYRKGLLSNTLTRDSGGSLFDGEAITYADPASVGPAQTSGSFFPKETKRVSSFYEALTADPTAPVESLEQDRTWDDHGNLLTMDDHGESSAGPGAGEVSYAILYDPTLMTQNPKIFRPKEVTACAGSGCSVGAAGALRDRTATYDSRGALLAMTNTVVGGNDPVSGTPYTGASGTNPTWTFTYDAFGNVHTAATPQGPADPSPYTLTYTYDAIAETYRTNIADSFGYTSSSSPDFNFGAVASEMDVNGYQTVFTRDEFGRLIVVDAPTDVGASEHTIAFCYSELGSSSPPAGCPPSSNPVPAFATTAHKDILHPGDPIVTATFSDGLDRVIQTKKDITKDDGTSTGVPGMSVSGAIVFDPRGRVAKQGQPVFDSGAATSFVAAPLVNATLFGYDVTDRTTSVQTPDGALTTTSYGVDTIDGAQRLATKVRDANFNANSGLPTSVHETFRDARGNVVAVQESNQVGSSTTPTTLITRYAYDPLDELARVTDAKGNATTATYDTVGRMVALTSPDTGLTTYSFDKPGNLGAKQTANLSAKNQSIHYQYLFNRLQQVKYPVSPPVVYTYGASDETGETSFNVAGRVKQETSEAGTKTYEYDSLGNVTQQSWSLFKIDDEDDTFNATMAYTYDDFGRLLTISFPGQKFQETVAYGYDAGGNVTTAIGTDQKGNVTNYLLGMGYDEFEQRTRLVSGNGITTTYGYDPLTRRLKSVNASERDPLLVQLKKPARAFQGMVYSYDPVGNVTQIQNNAPFDPQELGQVLVGTKTETFSYDDLYQLKTAVGVHQPTNDDSYTYGLNFAYDAIGNITQKAQTSASQELDQRSGKVLINQTNLQQTYTSNYTYAGPRPHAPTEVDDTVPLQQKPNTRALTYDADGNQVQWVKQKDDKRVVTFDEENRISFVQENGLEQSEVLYDGAGQRAVKQANGVDQVAYFGPNLTLRDGLFSTKNIFAGSTRIASRLDPDNDGDGPVLYFHDDHLGSTNFLTDSQQNLQAHEEYFPSGELWIDETSDPQHTQAPYLFTGKELDTETNLYYFGARYYDPRLSVWVSPDPILDSLMHGAGVAGGVYTPSDLGVYSYSRNNPILLRDPNGREAPIVVEAAVETELQGKPFEQTSLSQWARAQHPC